MNKKVLASAVAATLAAPLAAPMAMAQDDHQHLSIYARINNAISYRDVDAPATDADWDVRNVSSRLGLKGSVDLDNGMTVNGRYEFSTFTDREGTIDTAGNSNTAGRGGINDTRLGWVSLSGNAGTVKIGQQWSAFFNHVGTYMSPSFSLGYYLGSSIGTKPLRTSNTISWAHSAGPVSWQLDGRLSSDGAGADLEKNISQDRGEDVDGLGLGISLAATEGLTLALAFDKDFYDTDAMGLARDDDDRIGAGVSWSFAENHQVNVSFYNIDEGIKSGVQGRDEDTVSVYYHGNWGPNKLSVGYLTAESGNRDLSQIAINFYHKFGGGFQAYMESAFVDDDNSGFFGGDVNHIIVGARYDF